MVENEFQGLRRLRFEHGFTQKALAELTGLERTSIHKIEEGTRTPSLSTAVKLASAFDITLDELIARIAPQGAQPVKTASTAGEWKANQGHYRLGAYRLHSRGKSTAIHFVDRSFNPSQTLCFRPLPEDAQEVELEFGFKEVSCTKCRNALRARGWRFGNPAPAPETATNDDVERLKEALEALNAGKGTTRQKSA